MNTYSRMELIRLALHHRCLPEQDYYLKRWLRIFFTAKALVCIALGLEAKADRPRWWDEKHLDEFWADPVVVAQMGWNEYQTQEYTAYEWDELVVGYDWRDWRYTVRWEGTP